VAITAVAATKGTASSGTSVTLTALAATAGNALLVGGSGYENGVTGQTLTVTRTGDTYTTDTQGDTSAATDLQRIGIASAPNVVAGPTNLVVTVSSAAGVVAFALEVAGLPASSIRDAASPAIKIGTSTSGSTNTLTNVTSDAIFVVYCGTEAGGTVTFTPGGSWTETVGGTTMNEKNAASFPAGGFSYQIVSSTGAQAGAWTLGSADWGGLIAVYRGTVPSSVPVGTPTWDFPHPPMRTF